MLRGIGRAALEIALGLGAFLLGAALVRSQLPPAEGGRLDQKLAYFEAFRDEYDAVAIGSSRVLHGLDTRLLEAELAGAGVRLRTFNLGTPGLETFEQDWLLRRVLALRPARLRWILMESGPVGLALPHHHAYGDVEQPPTARDVQWHDLRGTRSFLGALARVPLAPRRKLELALDHLGLAARNLASVGRGPDLVAALASRSVPRARLANVAALVRRTEGYQASERTAPLTPESARIARERLAGHAEESAREIELDELDAGVHRRQVAAAAEQGIELLHVTFPSFEGSPELLRLHELGVVPALLHFNDPARFPELFALEERFDLHHLNRRGAERLTRLVADAFLRRLGHLRE